MEWNRFSMSALRLIKQIEVTNGVSTVNIDNVFSADFDIYKITSHSVSSTASISDVLVRLINSSGSAITSSVYDWAYLRSQYGGTQSESRSTNNNHTRLYGVSYDNPEGTSGMGYIFNPYSSSSYTFFTAQNHSIWNNENSLEQRKYIAVNKSFVSCTGLQLYLVSGAFGTGTVFRIYGLRVDNG